MECIGPYRVEETLGTGRMGPIYKGLRPELGRRAAIQPICREKNVQQDLSQLVSSEAQAQARLRHPNLAAVYDSIDDHGSLFIATEYVEGTSLDVLLRKNYERNLRFSLSEAFELFEPILAALEYVHQHGIVHRDVKPSNVMVAKGQAKVLDFGLARLRDITSQSSSSGLALGTPEYMSPEQAQFRDADCRADLYSAAAIFFEMLAGRRLFPGKEGLEQLQCHRTEIPPELKSLVPEVPAGVSDAVAIALEKDPQLRFQTAADFLHALQEGRAGFLPIPPLPASETPEDPIPASAGSPALATPAQWSLPQTSRPLWHPVAFFGLLCLGVVLAFGLWKAWYSPSPPQRTESHASMATPVPPEPSPNRAPSPTPYAQDPSPPKTPPIVTRPKKPQPEATPVVTVATQPDPAELRRQEAERLRDEVREGLKVARADLAAQSFDSVQEKLDLLMGEAQKFPAELQPESEEIRSLRRKVNEALVAKQTRDREGELQQAAWETRLQQIQNLIEQGSFPEAEKLARDLGQEQNVPESVSARARQLRSQAKEELKKVFEGTTLGPTKNKLRKPPG